MANLVRNLTTFEGTPNTIGLYWNAPLGHTTTDDIIIERRTDQFPVEISNEDTANFAPRDRASAVSGHISGFTDYNQVEIFNGRVIRPTGAVTVSAGVINDAGNPFPVAPDLAGRIVRDADSVVYRILSNTAGSLTLDTTATPDVALTSPNQVYVVLPDFPEDDYDGFSGTATSMAGAVLTDITLELETDDLRDMILTIGGDPYIILSNTATTITLHANPGLTGAQAYSVADRFAGTNATPLAYVDTFVNTTEAAARTGTGLLDETYYHYTAFSKATSETIFQASFSHYTESDATMAIGLSVKDRETQDRLYRLWPRYNQITDENGHMYDNMDVFGQMWNTMRSHINLCRLYNSRKIKAEGARRIPEQFGLDKIEVNVGYGAYRRLGWGLNSVNKLKGSKLGISEFIRLLTEWYVPTSSIDDGTSIQWLRFWGETIAPNNARLFGFSLEYNNRTTFIEYDYKDATSADGLGSTTATRTADTNGVNQIGLSTDDWIVNQWAGYNIVTTNAPGAVPAGTYLIDSNTATTITSAAMGGNPGNADYYLEYPLGGRSIVNNLGGAWVEDNTDSWIAGEWVGGEITFTSGVESGNTYTITASTTTRITVAAFGVGPGAGDEYYLTYKSGTIKYWGNPDLSDVAIGDTFVGADESQSTITAIPSASTLEVTTGMTPSNVGDYGTTDGFDSGCVFGTTVIESAGRFLNTTIGVVIPGSMAKRMVAITIDDIALYEGITSDITSNTITDSLASFPVNALIGAYVIPKEDEPTQAYRITGNTGTVLTIDGTINNLAKEGNYAILSPINKDRLLQLVKVIKDYLPSYCVVTFHFENS